MISHRLDLALSGGVEARVRFSSRGDAASGGSSRWPYSWANLASHVGDEPASVVANRTALAATLGLPATDLSFMSPNHGRGVAIVTEPTGVLPGSEIDAVDALVSDRRGVGLVALSADCVPVILVDPGSAVVAAVHSGWKGLVVDVVGAAVAAMLELGARRSGLQALLGPAICGVCYPVPSERAEQVAATRPEAVTTSSDGQPAVDVRLGLLARLGELGVTGTAVGGCTAHDAGYFSHRRDGRTGRQGAAVAIVPAA